MSSTPRGQPLKPRTRPPEPLPQRSIPGRDRVARRNRSSLGHFERAPSRSVTRVPFEGPFDGRLSENRTRAASARGTRGLKRPTFCKQSKRETSNLAGGLGSILVRSEGLSRRFGVLDGRSFGGGATPPRSWKDKSVVPGILGVGIRYGDTQCESCVFRERRDHKEGKRDVRGTSCTHSDRVRFSHALTGVSFH